MLQSGGSSAPLAESDITDVSEAVLIQKYVHKSSVLASACAQNLFCLSERIVAAESCCFAAEVMNFVECTQTVLSLTANLVL